MEEEDSAFIRNAGEIAPPNSKAHKGLCGLTLLVLALLVIAVIFSFQQKASEQPTCPAPLQFVPCPCANTCPPTCTSISSPSCQPGCGCAEGTFMLGSECIPGCSAALQSCAREETVSDHTILPWETSESLYFRIAPPDFECARSEDADDNASSLVDVQVHFAVIQRNSVLGNCSTSDSAPPHYVSYISKTLEKRSTHLVRADLVACLDMHEREFTANTTRGAWYFYLARLRALPPNYKIRYQVGVLPPPGTPQRKHEARPWRVFTSPTSAGGEQGGKAVLVFGDTAMVGAQVVLPAMARDLSRYDLALHMGDSSYATNKGECYDEPFGKNITGWCGFDCKAPTSCYGAGDRLGHEEMEKIYHWAKLFDSTLGGRLVLVSTPGNHDNDAPFALTYRARLNLPPVVRASMDNGNYNSAAATRDKKLAIQHMSKQPSFFSFDHGLMHVVMLGTEDNPVNAYEKWDGLPLSAEMEQRFEAHYGVHSPQYRWLEADLKRANQRRAITPWLVLYTHRPMYHTAQHHVWCGKGGDWYACKFVDTYEPLFHKYGVNLFLAGHSHHYARTLPMYRNAVDLQRGIVYIIVGNGGTELIGNKWHTTPDWLAARDGTSLGYSRFWVHNASALYWEHIVVGLEEEEKILDAAWIKNLV